MIEGSCHCGAIKFEINGEAPKALTDCNCSTCHRYGCLTAYYNPKDVKFISMPKNPLRYIWGDKMLARVFCDTCGSYSHWESLDPEQTERMGLNARLFTNLDISQIKLRKFDGRDTWKFLNE